MDTQLSSEDSIIQMENVEMEVPEVEMPSAEKTERKKYTKKEKREDEKKFFIASLDSILTLGINKVILASQEQKLEISEVSNIKISESYINLVLYYFPDFSIEHPIFMCLISSSALLAIINSKIKKVEIIQDVSTIK